MSDNLITTAAKIANRQKVFNELSKQSEFQPFLGVALDTIVDLRQQLADHIKREVMLRDVLADARVFLYTSQFSAYSAKMADEALAATADLSGVILCHAEPVAEVKKHTGSFKDMAIIVWTGEQPAEGTQLHRALEPTK